MVFWYSAKCSNGSFTALKGFEKLESVVISRVLKKQIDDAIIKKKLRLFSYLINSNITKRDYKSF